MSSLSPQPPALGHGLLCAALLPLVMLFILLRNTRLQQNWLHHIFQRSLPLRKHYFRQETLIKAVLILTVSALRCRGGGEGDKSIMGEGTWISGAPVHATTSEHKDKGTGVWTVALERAQKLLRTNTELNKVLRVCGGVDGGDGE